MSATTRIACGSESDVRHRPLSVAGAGWLAAAGAVYAVSWLPSVWFWRELMRAVGGRVSFADAARAYYCGHLGKYIPGKAMVLVIRAAMVKDRGCPPLRAAITASYETLTMMGTGMALGAAIAPLLFRDWMAAHLPLTGLSPLAQSAWALAAVTLLIALSLPFLSKLLTWIAAKATPAASVADKHVEISTGSPAETAQPLMHLAPSHRRRLCRLRRELGRAGTLPGSGVSGRRRHDVRPFRLASLDGRDGPFHFARLRGPLRTRRLGCAGRHSAGDPQLAARNRRPNGRCRNAPFPRRLFPD